jgi:predicted metalloprotease
MGGGFGLPAAGVGGMGVVGLVIYLLVSVLGGGGGGGMPALNNAPSSAGGSDELKDFVTFVVNDVEDSWKQQFASTGRQWQDAPLVLYTDFTQTACGGGSAQSGPFYCPADRKVYLDLTFFQELRDRFGAPGDFAQAYVIAHELGHHVQHILGIDQQVRQLQQQDPGGANPLSVRLELQADCLAGVWGHSAQQRGLLESGDVQEGLDAAAAVGDDRLQREAGQRVNPDSFTHGSSQQRTDAFNTGFESGSVSDCGV